MAKIDIILGSKGGIGKSHIAWLLAQYRASMGEQADIIDTDPSTDTLTQYKGLNCIRIPMMDVNGQVYDGEFDKVMKQIENSGADYYVIDSGASNYVQMMNYIGDEEILDTLLELGHEVHVNIIVCGGDDCYDTIVGCNNILTTLHMEGINNVVWLNEYQDVAQHNNIRFLDSKTYKDHKSKIKKVIALPFEQPRIVKAIKELKKRRLTFDEGIANDDFDGQLKRRFARLKNKYFGLLEQL